MATLTCLDQAEGENWVAYHGDCVDVVRQLPKESVGFSIYSPPFSSLFIYSDSERDMGNSSDDGEFMEHYRYLVQQKWLATKPGRLTAVHCSDLPSHKWRDGHVGAKDFSGDIRQLHENNGWHYVRRITIWRDPVVEMTRTKAINLLYKQVQKDTASSWPGMADYLLLFRKPGDNAEPIRHTPETFPLSQWQKWASPVWMDINQTDTLNATGAFEAADERHLCPLQRGVIERGVTMWSNPGDVVLSPFMGIGSEGVQSLKQRRRFVGVELKESYWRTACKHLRDQAQDGGDLFG